MDRLLALLLRFRYRQVVTLKRANLTMTVFWVVTLVCTTTYFWNYDLTLWYSYIVIFLCLATSIFSYVEIFWTLQHHQIQVQNSVHQEQPASHAMPLNMAWYKKAVSSALWLQLVLVLCYLPYGIVEVLFTHNELSSSAYLTRLSTATLIFVNSSLNPALYCWKIRKVRQAVKDTIRQFYCSSS